MCVCGIWFRRFEYRSIYAPLKIPNRELTGTESERKLRATVLLVDSDLGFVFWLGHALDSAGYTAVPAQCTKAARELIQKHRIPVDILVIDPLLPDAFPFIFQLRQSQRSVAVVAAIAEDWEELPPMTEVDAVIRKPRRLTLMAAVQWINLIQDLSAKAAEAISDKSHQRF